MPTPENQRSESAAAEVPSPAASRDGDSFGPLTPDQIQRWAALIADGAGEFPQELPAPDRDRLVGEVRRRLRARLITLVARAIAQDLYRRKRGRDDGATGEGRDLVTEEHGGSTP